MLARRFDDFATAEDAVQEALLAAATQWPVEGVPGNPRGWLIQVAYRRMIELVRAETARRRREDLVARREPDDRRVAPAVDDQLTAGRDDTLVLLFLCCHPALSPASAIALTLRAVGGLSTAEIAHAFLVPEATMAQRISRAKQRIRDSGVPFRMPEAADRAARLAAVRHVLYLIFTEGHTSSAGPDLRRVDLSAEAIRLTRALHERLPDDSETAGLLALMLLTEARSPARTGPSGELISSPSRTAAGGTRRPSPRASTWSPGRCPGAPSARTRSRPPSPPCTTRRRRPRRPTGRRSSPSTRCSRRGRAVPSSR